MATSTVAKLLDYVLHAPEDSLRSYACVEQRYVLIGKYLKWGYLRGGLFLFRPGTMRLSPEVQHPRRYE